MPRGAGRNPLERLAGEPPHPAVEVADRRLMKPARDPGKHRIAKVSVERRHGARLDPAGKPVAHDQIGPVLERVDKVIELAPVIGIIGIGHDEVLAARRRGGGADRGAIALDRLVDDTRAQRLGDGDRAIRRAVVAHDNFAMNAAAGESVERLCDAQAQRPFFVQARQDRGHERSVGVIVRRGHPDHGAHVCRGIAPHLMSPCLVPTGSLFKLDG